MTGRPTDWVRLGRQPKTVLTIIRNFIMSICYKLENNMCKCVYMCGELVSVCPWCQFKNLIKRLSIKK